jgi:hypothetical protein
MMMGISGIGNTPGERTMRTNSAPLSSGSSQSMIDQQIAHDLAHELAVVDHQHAKRRNQRLDFALAQRRLHATPTPPPSTRAASRITP